MRLPCETTIIVFFNQLYLVSLQHSYHKFMKRFFLYITAVAVLLTATCNLQHENEDPVIPVIGVTLNPSSVSLLVDKTLALEVAVTPSDATNQTVTWNTSDDCAATVNTSGGVTAVAPGTVTITAATNDGVHNTLKIQQIIVEH